MDENQNTRPPIEIGSREKISEHELLLDDFIDRILQLPWAFISDESTLWDFHMNLDSHELVQRIKHTFGVDVSDIQSGRIVEILDRIASTR